MTEIRIAKIEVHIIKYLGDTPVVVYEAKEPAEIYQTLSNWQCCCSDPGLQALKKGR